jgi:hypothetical protein
MKKLNGKIFLFIGIVVLVLCGSLFLSGFVQAQPVTTSTLGLGYGEATGLGTTDLRVMVANVIRIALGLIGIILVVLILFAGFLWLTSQGEQDKIDKAKKLLTSAVIGLVIILTSYAIASYVLNKLVTATTAGVNNGNDNGGGNGNGGGGGFPQDIFQVRDLQPRGQLKIKNVVVRITLSQPLVADFINDDGKTLAEQNGAKVERIKADGSWELVPGILTVVPSNHRQVLFTPDTPCVEGGVAKCFVYNAENPELNRYRVTIDTTSASAFLNDKREKVSCLGKTCQAEFIVGSEMDNQAPIGLWDKAVMANGREVILVNNVSLSQAEIYNLLAKISDDYGVVGADFYLNDNLVIEKSPDAPVTNFNVGFDWNATTFLGEQNLKVKTYDSSDNFSEFFIKVNVTDFKNGNFQVRNISPKGQLANRDIVVKITLNQPIKTSLIKSTILPDFSLKSNESIIVERIAKDNTWERLNGSLRVDPRNWAQVLFTPPDLCPDGGKYCFPFDENNVALNKYRVTVLGKDSEQALINKDDERIACNDNCQVEFTLGKNFDIARPEIVWGTAKLKEGNGPVIDLTKLGGILSANTNYVVTANVKDDFGDAFSGVVGANLYLGSEIEIGGGNLIAEAFLDKPVGNFSASFDFTTPKIAREYGLMAKAYDVSGNDSEIIKTKVNILPEHCFDGQRNIDIEDGVDCGGKDCLACPKISDYFEWQFTTCDNCIAPSVVEDSSCANGLASPAPRKDSTNNFTNTLISATFNTDMDDVSFNNGTVLIKECGNELLPQFICRDVVLKGDFTFGNSGSSYEYFILSTQNLTKNYWYKVTLTDGIKSAEGKLLEQYSWDFQVNNKEEECQADAVKVSPTNRVNNPADQANNQPVILGEKVWYSAKPFNQGTCNICPDTFAWKWSSSDPDKASIDGASIWYKSLLTANKLTEKTATITASIIENQKVTFSGNAYVDIVAPAPQVIFDTTCTGQLSSPSPYINTNNACPNGAVAVRFTTVMDESLLESGALSLQQILADNKFKDIAFNKIERLDGVDNYGAQGLIGLIVWPKENLPVNARFVVTLNQNIKNIYNRFLIGKKQWEFFTAKTDCLVNNVLVNPDFIKLPFNTAQVYKGLAVNNQTCQSIRSEGKWRWQVNDFNIAGISQEAESNQATVTTRNQNGLTRVIASLDGINNTGNGNNGRLQVGDNVLNILFNSPTGDAVCKNTLGMVAFNLPIKQEMIDNGLKEQINISGVENFEMSPLSNNTGFVFYPQGGWVIDQLIIVKMTGLMSETGQMLEAENCKNVEGKTSGLSWNKDTKTCFWQFKVVDKDCLTDHVNITPASQTIFSGDKTQFTAFSFSKEGWPLKIALNWSVDPAVVSLSLSDSKNFGTVTALAVSQETEIKVNVNDKTAISRLTVLPALIAPKIIRTEPDKGINGVCTNILIMVDVADGLLDPKTINNNTLEISNDALPIAGKWILENNAYNNTSRIKFLPNEPLPDKANITFQIKEGIMGLNKKPLDRGGYSSFSFTTSKLCTLKSVRVVADEKDNSNEWLFGSSEDDKSDNDPNTTTFDSIADGDKKFIVAGYNNNQILTPTPAYNWSWKWSSDQTNVANVVSASNDMAIIAAQKQNGTAKIVVTAEFDEIEKNKGAVNLTGVGQAIVDLCFNRWDPKGDKTGVWTDDYYNLEMSYCRDFGVEGNKSDDLPAVEVSLKVNGPGGAVDKSGLLKEYLLRVPTTSDLIGVRIYSNPQGLAPLDWFKAQGLNSGNPRQLTIDGYPAFEEGRTLYVGATNVFYPSNVVNPGVGGTGTGDNSNGNGTNNGGVTLWLNNLWATLKNLISKIFVTNSAQAADSSVAQINDIQNFIFLISYNQTNDSKTLEIVKRLKNSLVFNTNLKNNSDPELKVKIQRDAKRLVDIRNILNILENYYKKNKNTYPTLNSGSFLKGMSFSSWPSWSQSLGRDLGISLPLDPLNKFGACLKCDEEIKFNNGGFESDLESWFWEPNWELNKGQIEIRQDKKIEGNKSLLVNVAEPINFNLSQYVPGLLGGATYEATAQVYIESGRVSLTLAGAPLVSESISPPDYKGWVTLKSHYAPSESSDDWILTISNFNGLPTRFLVDNVQVKSLSGSCGYDSVTCWNPTGNNGTGAFACSASNSYFYSYQAKGQNSYILAARLEAVDAAYWRYWWLNLSAEQKSKLKLFASPDYIQKNICTSSAVSGRCGDGIVGDDEFGKREACEPGQFRDDCSDIKQAKWYKPVLIDCNNECQWTRTTPLTEEECGGWCGDTKLNSDEECDASIAGYVGGGTKVSDQYACSNTCRNIGGWCDDGIVQTQYNEQCDGENIVGWDCPDGKTLVCSKCKIQCKDSKNNLTSDAYQGRCGNNIIESGETCDICSPFATDECDPKTHSFGQYQYKCNNQTCKFTGGSCGDGNYLDQKDFEGCDSSVVSGGPAETSDVFNTRRGFGGGKSVSDQYSCTNDCQDTGGWCGDGIWQSKQADFTYDYEKCDSSVIQKVGQSLADFNTARGFGGGTDENHQYDCSDCKKQTGGWCGDFKVTSPYEQFDKDVNGNIIVETNAKGENKKGSWDCLGSKDDIQDKIYNNNTCKLNDKVCAENKQYKGLCGNGTLEGLEMCELNTRLRTGDFNKGTDINSKDWSCFRSTVVTNGVERNNPNNTLTCNGCIAECNNPPEGKRGTPYQGKCGDGLVTGPEECDIYSLNKNGSLNQDVANFTKDGVIDSCKNRGAIDGDLSCNADCTVNTDECYVKSPECGDGRKQPGEECDAKDFGVNTGEKCETGTGVGYGAGYYSYTSLYSKLKNLDYNSDLVCNLNCKINCVSKNCILNGNDCKTINAVNLGETRQTTCNSGFGNCDNLYSNGCEVDLTTGLYAGVMNQPLYTERKTLMPLWKPYEYYRNEVGDCGICGNKAINATCESGVIKCKEGYKNCDGTLTNGCESKISDAELAGHNINCDRGVIACNNDFNIVAPVGQNLGGNVSVFEDCKGFNLTNYLANTIPNLLKEPIKCPSKDCENALSNLLFVNKTIAGNEKLYDGCTEYKEDANNCCGRLKLKTGNVFITQCAKPGSAELKCIADRDDCNGDLNKLNNQGSYINGDGCETNLTNNKYHCGTCDTVCPDDTSIPGFPRYGRCVNSKCDQSIF